MTMVKNGKRYYATVCLGKARTLQPPGSDVSMDIPDGSRGLYMMRVHTDLTDLEYVVKDEECFVSPVVEIFHYNDSDSTAKKTRALHTQNSSLPEEQITAASHQSQAWKVINWFSI